MQTTNEKKYLKPAILLVLLAAATLAVLKLATPLRPDEGFEASRRSWTNDLPAALAKARAEDKLVLVDFTGSDWCPPCKALFKNVFSAPEFEAYASNQLVLVEIDFPQRKEQSRQLRDANEALSKRFNIEGFPTVLVLNAEGRELKRETGYGGATVKDYISELQQLKP